MQRALASSLAALAVASLPSGLTGCTQKVVAETGPYQVWREVQQALRHSPDHAPARARALVEQGQLEALHQFVRDEIRLISPHPDDFRLDGNPRGVRVTLRSGAGTGREKAELLADLVRQTGGQARVVEVTSNEPAKAPGSSLR